MRRSRLGDKLGVHPSESGKQREASGGWRARRHSRPRFRALHCGTVLRGALTDLGAEVIRIERMGGGEDRGMIPVGAGPATEPFTGGGAKFLAMNRNKLGMTLDPAAPKGREITRKLVATADVVVANLPPRVLRSLALDLDSLRQAKPDIILTTVTGFGSGGPLSHNNGFDGIGQSMSGAVYLSGTPEQPIAIKVPWVDFGIACLSAVGTLVALIERGKTGRGQRVEGALLRTDRLHNAALIEQALTGVNRIATLNRGFNSAPADIFRTEDGWIVATVIGGPMFRRLIPDAKTPGSVRRAPLHAALVREGFIDYVETMPKRGPLFPDLMPDRFGRRAGTATKEIGRWLRRVQKETNVLLVDKARYAPNHSWRHRFKSEARRVRIEEEVHDASTGHREGCVSDYGEYYIETVLGPAIETMSVGASCTRPDKIAPEISGRFLRFAVAPGKSMRKGDTVAELSNPSSKQGSCSRRPSSATGEVRSQQ